MPEPTNTPAAARVPDAIREKLDELRLLDQPQARAIEAEWPKTLEHLDAADDFRPLVVGTTMNVYRRLLEQEIDAALETARAL